MKKLTAVDGSVLFIETNDELGFHHANRRGIALSRWQKLLCPYNKSEKQAVIFASRTKSLSLLLKGHEAFSSRLKPIPYR